MTDYATFSAKAESDWQTILTGEFAEDISYYSASSETTKAIKAVVERQSASTQPYDDGSGVLHKARVLILTDATLGIETPAKEDKVTLDGEDWGVSGIWSDPMTGTATIEIERYVPVSKSPKRTRLYR